MRYRGNIEYQQYLKEDHWKNLRKRVLKRCPYCVGCTSTDRLHVHHIRYNLYNESNKDVLPLCESCHDMIHKKLAEMYPGIPLRNHVENTSKAFEALFKVKMPNWKKFASRIQSLNDKIKHQETLPESKRRPLTSSLWLPVPEEWRKKRKARNKARRASKAINTERIAKTRAVKLKRQVPEAQEHPSPGTELPPWE